MKFVFETKINPACQGWVFGLIQLFYLQNQSFFLIKKKKNSLSVLSGKELVNKIPLSADSCLIFIESPEFNHGNFESQMKKRSPPGRSASSSVYS